jgi:exonuclease III
VSPKFTLSLQRETIQFNCPKVNHNNFLKIVSINAQSLANIDHIAIFRNLLSKNVIDIAAVSETWLKSKHPDKLCNVDGYQLIRNDREGLGGGGVALFVKKGLKFKILDSSPNSFDQTRAEFLICDIDLHDTHILVAAIYRRPHKKCRFDKLLESLRKHVLTHDNIILLGDFNIKFNLNSTMTTRLIATLEDLNLTRLPIQNTHRQGKTVTTIDAIFTSTHITHNSFGSLSNLLSSHDILYAVFPLEVTECEDEYYTIREFHSVPQEELLDRAMQIDWSCTNAQFSLEDKIIHLNSKILDFYNEHLPLKNLKFKRKFQPRLPNFIQSAIKHRDSMRKLATKFRHFFNYFDLYRAAKNRVKQLIATFHRSVVYSKLSNLIGSDQIWKTLRNLGLVKEKSYSKALPEDLNQLAHSLTMGPDIDETKIKFDFNLVNRPQGEKFYFSHAQPIKVKNAIFDIDTSAEGTDGICVKMIKLIWQTLVFPITHIIDTSLQTSIFPTCWKSALLNPIPKIRNPVNTKDFRPISLLCTLSKVVEKIVGEQVLDYLNSQNILDPFQSGYRKLYSTATALLKITEDMRMAIFKKRVIVSVFLDFSKAFECVNHKILLRKLSQMNLSDPVVKWFESYLSERQCAAKGRNGARSEWIKVERGVPQGTVLGPLLFSLYIHDINVILRNRCKYHIYADDIQLFIECDLSELHEAIKILNFILEDIANWSERHGLKLNPSKTQAMLIASAKIHKQIKKLTLPTLTLSGTQITFSDTVKNLGVFFDTTLSWDRHISSICQKVYGSLNNLHKFRAMTPETIRLRLVKSLILPHFDYCSFVYCNLTSTQRKRLQNLMHAAISYVYDIPFASRLTKYYFKAEILQLHDRHNLEILLMTHKIVHKNCPTYLLDMLTMANSVNTRATRSHKFKIHVPRVGVNTPENSFVVKASRLWNDLPADLCSNIKIESFKSELRFKFLQSYKEA